MGTIRHLITFECDRCNRQQTIDPVMNDDNWVIYENMGTHGTVTLCPSCVSFFYSFMQGEGVKPL